MDFSKNYTCRVQNEVQSAFKDSNQVTIHPMMVYYKVKTDGDWILKKHSLIEISDDPKHDAHFVHLFRQKLSVSVYGLFLSYIPWSAVYLLLPLLSHTWVYTCFMYLYNCILDLNIDESQENPKKTNK